MLLLNFEMCMEIHGQRGTSSNPAAGVEKWNEWRAEHPRKTPDLAGLKLIKANLSNVNFEGTKLSGSNLTLAIVKNADLRGANLQQGNLYKTDFGGSDLTKANLREANLRFAIMSATRLRGANLYDAVLCDADLTGADLTNADLRGSLLLKTIMDSATLTGCRIYGTSAWDVKLNQAIQSNLIITPDDQSIIQVDNLEVAQFIYLLLNNRKIRDVIDTVTSKVVLILGRFTDERKAVLEGIRDELRKCDYLPVLFDFEKPSSQTTQETIATLAHMARFVIADLTDAKSVLQELAAIIPCSPSVFVQPLLLASQEEPGMLDFFRKFPWVLEPVRYTDQELLMAGLNEAVIAPAEKARAQAAK